LYAATSIKGLKTRGSLNNSYTYFSLYDLGEIARDKDSILGHGTSFDKDTAKKVYQECTKQNFAKWLPREEISEEICNGDTSPIAITTDGKQHCETMITDYLDELPSRATQTEPEKLEHRYEQEIQACGLNWLHADYFQFHTNTEKDFENWKKGFSFELQSIKMKKELRREVIDDITKKLDNEGKLLILGESGTSKTTILMEIMCDFFDRGFEIFYNYGDSDIRNMNKLINLIEAILKDGNKILVAIDNAHEERTSPVFYVIDKIFSSHLTGNLKLILTARLPEFDLFVKDRLDKVPEGIRKSIAKLTSDPNFKYQLPYFTKEETKKFIRLYSDIIDKDQSDKKSQEVFDDTKGNPIMVKFSLFSQGLSHDVRERHDRYLKHPLQMKAMLICSLLDIASLKITNIILERCGVLQSAYYIIGATLYQSSKGTWKTIHPRWDEELLSMLYNEETKAILLNRIPYLQDAIDSIFDLNDETITESVIGTLYDLCTEGIMPIDIVDTVLEIDPKHVCGWYNKGNLLAELDRNEEAIRLFDIALKIDPKNVDALAFKGCSLHEMGKYDEAIKCFDTVLEVDPKNVDVWNNKGLALQYLEKHEEAIKCYNKALKLDPKNAHA
jgi:tetratricopeptide (TPR) repeat protein